MLSSVAFLSYSLSQGLSVKPSLLTGKAQFSAGPGLQACHFSALGLVFPQYQGCLGTFTLKAGKIGSGVLSESVMSEN